MRTKTQRRIYDIHQHINNKSPGYYNDVSIALKKGFMNWINKLSIIIIPAHRKNVSTMLIYTLWRLKRGQF